MNRANTLLLLAALAICAPGCATPPAAAPGPAPNAEAPAAPTPPGEIEFLGGDGSSIDTAVLIHGAAGELQGIRAEGKWIGQRFPGARKKQQALLNRQNRMYDLITVDLPDGSEKSFYFDITEFFGKLDIAPTPRQVPAAGL